MQDVRIDAVLADDAEDAGGLITLRAAGWNNLMVPELPYVAPRIALGVFLQVGVDGRAATHVLTVRLEDPHGDVVPLRVADGGPIERVRATITLEAPEDGTRLPEHTLPLGMVFHDVPFAFEGPHRFVLALAGEDVKSVLFDVQPLD